MELDEFKEKFQQPLFKEWLISNGGKNDKEEAGPLLKGSK
jgi:hypothetical protein